MEKKTVPAASLPPADCEKVEYVNEPLRIPRAWIAIFDQIARATTSPRAVIERRALRLGLPLVAKQESMGEKWVRATLAHPPVARSAGRPARSGKNERTNRPPSAAKRSPRSR